MGVCYNRLWKLMIDRKLKKKDLRERANISTASMAKLANDEYLSLDVLIRVCAAFAFKKKQKICKRSTQTPLITPSIKI